MKFIVKLFSEITIKSRPVRKRLIQRLQNNLNILLKRVDDDIKVSGFWDKIEVFSENEDPAVRQAVIEVLERSPGVQFFLEVEQFPLGDFHNVYEKVREIYAPRLTGKTFKVRCKRTGDHDFSSVDLERYVGGGLNQHTDAAGVDIRNPQVWVDLEVLNDKLFVVSNSYDGLGGYPLGSQDAVVSLISGGFDSIVASYLSMRRGCKTHFLFFNLGGQAHEIGVKQVALYLWQKYGACARVKFVTVSFEEVVGEILSSVHHSQMGVILKRMMMRAGEQVAQRVKAGALVTGESVAQVSSQTMPNLSLIDSVTDTLVLRPLVLMDKQNIIDIATDIGTYDFAKNMPEYCGVISDKPTTHARRERIEEEESNFDFDVLDRALEQAQVITIDEIVEDVNAHATVEALTRVEEHQILVDIRAPHEQEKKPLNMPGCTIQSIPFFNLGREAEKFSPDKEYLLYCEKGVMSQMQAQHLQERGYSNVKVYRPL